MSGAAERQRRYRERQRAGRRVFRVEVDEAALEIALVAYEFLAAATTDDPKEVERALYRMIVRFCDVTCNGPVE